MPEQSPIGGILRRVARSRITAGVLASYANQAASAASNFLILPLYLRYLGAERYGLWVTISGIVAYFGLLNFGVVQTTANRFGSAFVARNEALSRVLASGFWSFARTIGIAALVAAAASPWIPWQVLFRGSEALRMSCLRLLARQRLRQDVAVRQGCHGHPWPRLLMVMLCLKRSRLTRPFGTHPHYCYLCQ